jgi:hypothetical protein
MGQGKENSMSTLEKYKDVSPPILNPAEWLESEG